MKNFLLLAILILPFNYLFAQNLSIHNVDIAPKLKAECQDDDSAECFERSMMKYIRTNLDFRKLENDSGGTAYAQFVVNKEGEVTDIRTRSTLKTLEKEAERLIKRLKIEEPAEKNGKKVSITYTVPVTFQQRQYNNYDDFLSDELAGKDFIELTEVYKAPRTSECKADKTCLKKTIQNTILKKLHEEKFKDDEIRLLNLSFVITKHSEITNIIALVPNAKMQRITKSVLEAIEIKEPGLDKNGKEVNVILKYKFSSI